jgi:Uma2 family endonuclease
MASNIQGRTELIEGLVYDVSPEHEPHAYAVQRLCDIIRPQLPPGQTLRSNSPVAIPDWYGKNAPQPNVAIINDQYYDPGLTYRDTHAVVEVSDSTYQDDRARKIPIYVKTGIPTYVVNIPARWVEVYLDDASLECENGIIERVTFRILGIPITVSDLFRPTAR